MPEKTETKPTACVDWQTEKAELIEYLNIKTQENQALRAAIKALIKLI